ncbi:MAG: hypothetical protein HY426_00290 [Candidatus Levybacteria bacterium]|nr:hypothetical protein [Candidatus Levybacteria bacterium]
MRKIIAIVLFSVSLFYLINFGAFAQEKNPPIKDSATTIVGTGEGIPTTPNPTECAPSVPQCLSDEFNVIIRGSYTFAEQRDVYEILSEAGTSATYKNLLKTSGPTVFNFVNDSSKGGGCPAVVSGDGDGTSTLTLYNYSLSDCRRDVRLSRLVHETGHIIRNGHGRLFQLFTGRAYYPKNSDCYFRDGAYVPPYFIKTYDTDFAHSINAHPQGDNETMAEFMALTLVKQNPYPEKCPIGWGWVKLNIFGNYSF